MDIIKMYSFSFNMGYFVLTTMDLKNSQDTTPSHYALTSKLRHSVAHLTSETPCITENAILCANVVGNAAY